MNKIYLLRFLIVPLLILQLVDCSSPTKSKSKPTVITITDIWFSDAIDNDGDGYYSEARFNFDLDVNKSSLEVFILLGIRVYDPEDTSTTYYQYLESDNFSIGGTGNEDARFIYIGLPNDELLMASYDFLLQVFVAGSNENNPPNAQATLSDFPELGNVPIEESTTDFNLNIYDALWYNSIDNDGDGYYSQRDLVIDVDKSGSDTVSSDIYLEIYVRQTGTSTYGLLATTSDFNISGTSSSDAVAITITNGVHGYYDFKLVAYFANRYMIEDEVTMNDNSDLGSVPMETAAEDPLPQYSWIWYHDSIFEMYTHWPDDYGYFAVRFNHPSGATSCTVKKIRICIYDNPSYVRIRAWDNYNNYPDTRFYYPSTSTYLSTGWNEIDVDINVVSFNPFYIGYYQYYYGQPYLLIDDTSPDFTSYYNNLTNNIWYQKTNGDYAMEIYVEYTTTSQNGKSVTRSEWLSAE
jgi:hypothetical protein